MVQAEETGRNNSSAQECCQSGNLFAVPHLPSVLIANNRQLGLDNKVLKGVFCIVILPLHAIRRGR
jgi:hypothetical protein